MNVGVGVCEWVWVGGCGCGCAIHGMCTYLEKAVYRCFVCYNIVFLRSQFVLCKLHTQCWPTHQY